MLLLLTFVSALPHTGGENHLVPLLALLLPPHQGQGQGHLGMCSVCAWRHCTSTLWAMRCSVLLSPAATNSLQLLMSSSPLREAGGAWLTGQRDRKPSCPLPLSDMVWVAFFIALQSSSHRSGVSGPLSCWWKDTQFCICLDPLFTQVWSDPECARVRMGFRKSASNPLTYVLTNLILNIYK